MSRALARGLAVASAGATLAACALAALSACGGEDAAGPRPLAPISPQVAAEVAASAARPRSPRPSAAPPAGEAGGPAGEPASEGGATDGGATTEGASDAAAGRVHAGARPTAPELSFGAGAAAPGAAHPFRLAASFRAMRASKSGTKLLQMLAVVPSVIEARTRTGVDPLVHGEWLLVYGSKVAMPGPNANVLKHGRAEVEVTRALADAGLERAEAGPTSLRAELLGVRGVLLRPQAGMLALVPADRASDLAAALAGPFEPGVRAGELARVFVAEPAALVRNLPPTVTRGVVAVRPAADDGLDLTAEAECADAKICASTAAELDAFIKRRNSMVVRIATRSLLSGFAVRADGARLRATLHAAPEQVDAILGFLRAEMGLPARDLDRPARGAEPR